MWRMHQVIEAVEALPLLGGDFFADLAGVFARGIDARGDGRRMVLVEDECLSIGDGITGPVEARRIAERRYEALPVGFGAGAAGVEHETHGDVELAHGVLSPLEVAAHPIEAVGNTRKHFGTLPNSLIRCYSRTHVSLLPPPCEELTTSEPFSRATRVSPPGTMLILSPKRM